MIKEPAMNRHLGVKEAQRGEHLFTRFVDRNKTTFCGDAQRSQTEPGSSRTGNGVFVTPAHITSILYQSGLRIGPLPKIEECSPLQFVKEGIVFRSERRLANLRRSIQSSRA